MEKEQKQDLARKNKIVEFYQRGLISEAEFNGFMEIEKNIDALKRKDMSLPNYFASFKNQN